ncbi:MAG: hypothetical protein ACE37H_04870 [Phycisphaeraceae bacterium]
MLVSTNHHPDHATKSRPLVVQRSWRLQRVRYDAITANDARRRGNAASFESALRAIDQLGGTVECSYQLYPERLSQKLDITLHATIPNHQADSTLVQGALDQLEHAYSLQHVIARCSRKKRARENSPKALLEDYPNKIPGAFPGAGVMVTSTLESASLLPLPGQYSPGQPLQVRNSIDWAMVLSALADVAEPVIIRFRSATARREALCRQLDEAQRRWQLHQKTQRQREKRQQRLTSNNQQPRSRSHAEAITNATRWATNELDAVAKMSASAMHLYAQIDASNPCIARSVAEIIRAGIFDPDTATTRAIPTLGFSGNQGSDHEVCPGFWDSSQADDLLSMASTLCLTAGVAQVLTGPLVDSPLMLPSSMSASDETSAGKKAIVLGTRFDETVDRSSETKASLGLSHLPKHLSALGQTGFGKTGFIYQFLSECARLDPPLPATYITLAKNEGPALLGWLKNSDPRLTNYAEKMVFYGLHSSSPLKPSINPFALEDATPIERAEHAHRVLKSAIPLEGPLMANCQEACSDLCHDMQTTGVTPVIADLPDVIRHIQQLLGYTGDVQGNLGSAAEGRIGEVTGGQTGELFRSPTSLPRIEDLLARPHVISCGLAPANATALFCIDLLLRLERWLIANPIQTDDGRPRLVIVIDEIQEIAPRNPMFQGGDRPTATIEAAAIIAHCIKTLRSLGVSIIFASQHPGSIDAELLKSPGTCLALRQSQIEERQEIAGLIGLSPQQCEQLNGLEPGHGFVRSPGMLRPQPIVLRFITGVHDCPAVNDSELSRHCAQSAHHRTLAIESYQGQVTMREDRLLRAMAQLQQHRCRLRDLSQAAVIASNHTDRPDAATQLLAEIRRVAIQIQSDLAQQSRQIERQWARTLTPPPEWLVGWAETTRRSVKQKKQVTELCLRHRRLAGAYRHWIVRTKRAMQQAKNLMNP